MLKSMKTPIGRKATLLWINLAIDQRSVGKILIIKPGRCDAANKIIKKKKKKNHENRDN